MPGNCEAVGCTNHTLMSGKKPSFHRFPKDPERRKRWTIALEKLNRDGSEWQPSANARICGNHFITGKPNHNDPSHPDYIPTIFKHRKSDYVAQKMNRKHSARRQLKYDIDKPRINIPATSEDIGDVIEHPSTLQPSVDTADYASVKSEMGSKTNSPSQLKTPCSTSSPMIMYVLVSDTEQSMIYQEMDALRAERDSALTRLKESEEKLKKALQQDPWKTMTGTAKKIPHSHRGLPS